MKIKHLAFTILFIGLLAFPSAALAKTPTTVSNLMSLLKEQKQKATYDVNLNAPFSKEKSGIKEDISSETGELSIMHTLIDLPGRNGMDLVLQAEYRNRDAKVFNEGTRGGSLVNNYGQSVVAYYDVFDQNGYWLRTGGLLYPSEETIVTEWRNGQEKWIFTGSLNLESGGTVFNTGDICNATMEKNRALTAKYVLGSGWALDMPFLEIDGDVPFIHLQDGSTYKVDFNSTNGLEKYELTDLLFDKYSNFGSGNESSVYRLSFKDGDEFFFSADGFLVGQRDKFRNTIRYFYDDVSGLKLLTKIEDTVGRIVSIRYNDTGTTLTMGQKKIELIKTLIPGQVNKYYLSSFVDPVGRRYRYKYTFDNAEFDLVGKTSALNQYVNLAEIDYPTGAKTLYTYTKGRKNLGVSGSMEYFKVRERWDNNETKDVNRLKYQYLNEPDGYPVYKDADQTPATYRYETRHVNSKGLATRYIFDGRHLTIDTQVFGKRLFSETSTLYHDRYKLPVKVKEQGFNDKGDALENIDFFEYDSRGNVIAENHPVKTNGLMSDERKVFYVYDKRFNLLTCQKFKQDANTSVELKYTLTPDAKEVAVESAYANGKLMAKKSYTYNDYGNIATATTKKTKEEDVTEKYEYAPEYGYAYLTTKTVNVDDADGNVKSVKGSIAYDFMTGNKTGDTDGNGNTTKYQYDLLDRLVKIINTDQTENKNTYDDANNIATITDENNNQTIYYFDGLGKLDHVKDQKQNIELANLEYDDLDNVIKEIDAGKNYREYTYDQTDRLTKIADYDKQGTNLSETLVKYDEAFKDSSSYLQKIGVIKKADHGKADLITNYYYDGLDQLTKLGRVQGNREDFNYFWFDYHGNNTEVRDVKGNRIKYEYDGLGRLIKETNPLGKSKSYTYDYVGNQVARTDELGNVTRVDYNSLGRAIVQKAPFEPGKDSITKNYYDKVGNVVKTIDPEGAVTKFSYDQSNLVTSVEKVLGLNKSNFTRYVYDRVGNRTEVQMGLNSLTSEPKATTRYTYDSLDRITTYTDPMGKKETYKYDANGNVLETTDRNGKKINFTYDGLDRLTQKQAVFNGKLEKVQYTYDKLGNRTKMQDSSGLTKYEYDNLGRLSRVRQDSGISLTYSYNRLDQRVGMILSRSNDKQLDIAYEYDRIGRLIRAKEQGRTVNYNYDDAGHLSSTLNKATGVETNYRYNPAGLLKNLVNQKGSDILETFDYEYDRRGNETKKTDEDGTTQYYYDALSRLKTALMPNDTIQDYTYDNLGNLTDLVESSKGSIKETAYSYNRNSQLLLQTMQDSTETTEYRFDYDANGNQTSKEEAIFRNGATVAQKNFNFRYDDFNQLREVIDPNNKISTYNYNGDGLRTGKEVDGETTDFTWDGDNVVLESNKDKVKAKNFFGFDLVSRQTDKDTYYYLFNGHGDVTKLLNEQGRTVKDYNYDPFGNDLNNPKLTPGRITIDRLKNEVEKLDNPFQYAGEYKDEETGYYYLRARYYDPQIQRFISEDSLAKNSTWDEQIYAFANYNPINFVDPSGHAAVAAKPSTSKTVAKPVASTKIVAKNTTKTSSRRRVPVKVSVKPPIKVVNIKSNYKAAGSKHPQEGCYPVDDWIDPYILMPVPGGVAGKTGEKVLAKPVERIVEKGLPIAKNGFNKLKNVGKNAWNGLKNLTKDVVKKLAPKAGEVAVPNVKNAANVVAKNLKGTLTELKNGYKIEIPNGKKPIVVRIMNEGSGNRSNPYFRVSIDGKGSLTLEGAISNDRALTHIDLTNNYLKQIKTMIKKYKG
jgi:RHS repeat-associated protein